MNFPSYPTPWSVGPNDRKYYGTEILDANGEVIFKLWRTTYDDNSVPSTRELDGETVEEFWEWCSDSHWETEETYQLALLIVDLINERGTDDRPE